MGLRGSRNAVVHTLPDDEFGPSIEGGKPRSGGPDWPRVLLLAVSLVTTFAVLSGGLYGVLILLEYNAINRVDIDDPEIAFDQVPNPEGTFVAPDLDPVTDRTNILLVGSDSREGLTDEQLRAIGTDRTGTDLTDTIILLQIDPATDAAAMLSFPRDLLVTRCDGSRGRINEAFYIGTLQGEGLGPACLVQTVEALTEIPIDHYVRINFSGFVQIVDALGGVTFYIDEPLRDAYAGLDVPSGCVDFDGVTAIQYVRARRLDSGGDFGRMARQQRFAREMLKKATSVGTLLQPQRVASVISGISDTLETDDALGINDMIDLVTSVRNISAGAVDARTVPAQPRQWGEASVVEIIEEPAEELFAAFAEGELLPENIGTTAGPVELGPANVIPVQVQDGGSTDGNAEATAEVLEALGYTVSEVGPAENYTFEGSLILYPEDRADHAEILSESLGGVQIALSTQLEDDELILQLGETFDPEEYAPDPDPTASPSASPEPDPSASPTPVPGDLSAEPVRGVEGSDIQC